MKINIKKAAMFGLDARIALAIFGALSVISGAALYSAIQESKVVAFITEMTEIGKSLESYYIDTGVLPEEFNSNILKSSFLAESNAVKGWNGPYVSIPTDGLFLINPNEGRVHLMKLSGDPDWTTAWSDGACDGSNKCSIWARIYPNDAGKVINNELATLVDNKIDGGDGYSKGNFRWIDGYNLNIMPINN